VLGTGRGGRRPGSQHRRVVVVDTEHHRDDPTLDPRLGGGSGRSPIGRPW
jgi:hypothetical protein